MSSVLFAYYYHLYGITIYMAVERTADHMAEVEAVESGDVAPCHNSAQDFFCVCVTSHLISVSQFSSCKMGIIMVPCSQLLLVLLLMTAFSLGVRLSLA